MSSHLKSSAAIPMIDSASYVTKPIAVTVAEALRVSGIGKTRLYKHIKTKRVRVSKDGNRTLVIFEDLERLIADGISAAGAEPEHLKKSDKSRGRKRSGAATSEAPAAE